MQFFLCKSVLMYGVEFKHIRQCGSVLCLRNFKTVSPVSNRFKFRDFCTAFPGFPAFPASWLSPVLTSVQAESAQ